jgi:hypothetical protein
MSAAIYIMVTWLIIQGTWNALNIITIKEELRDLAARRSK